MYKILNIRLIGSKTYLDDDFNSKYTRKNIVKII